MQLAPGTLVAGRYRIERELGRGGMGAVYVAEHVNTGGRWALKVMHGHDHLGSDAAARFRREARASSRIQSENVVRVTDADVAPELDGAPFLVMELLEGEDLDHRLDTAGHLPPQEVVAILVQVARGLDKAHAAGVVHRDLKPENIFLHRREDGTTVAKVVDFGISKVLRADEDPSSMSVTKSGQIMGTPLYMSPEQARGRADEIGPGTDVWAIGLLAFRMLTGKNYWGSADSIASLFFMILSDDKPPPSSKDQRVDAAFDAWFLQCCALSPQDRFPSVGVQVSELSKLLLGRSAAPEPSVPPSEPEPAPISFFQSGNVETPPEAVADTAVALEASVSATKTEMATSVPPAAPRRSRLLIGAVAVVLCGIAGTAALRARQDSSNVVASLPSGGVASSGLPSGGVASSSVAPGASSPSGALVPLSADASDASVAYAIPSSSAVGSKGPPAGSTARVGARPPSPAAPTAPAASASAPPIPTKKPDLFDTQK